MAEPLDPLALRPLAEQRRHRQAEVPAEQRRLDRGDDVDRGAQVEGLQAATTRVAIGETRAHRAERPLHLADRMADDEFARVFERAADRLAARHFAHAVATGAVGHDHQLADEERAVRAAQVHPHRIAAGDRDHVHGGNVGRAADGGR